MLYLIFFLFIKRTPSINCNGKTTPYKFIGGGCRPKSWFVRKQTVSFIHKNKQIFIFPLFTGAYKYDIFDNATLNMLNILDILFYFWSNKKKIFNNIYYPISMRWEIVEIWTITYFIWCILPYFFLKIRVGLPSSL